MKYLFIFLFIATCGSQKENKQKESISADFTYLALGDSYTKGESVCSTCNFPSQLTSALSEDLNKEGTYKRIAETGWTTSDLLNGIAQEQPNSTYDLVTLSIGVNNQFQGKPFTLYEEEFPELLEKAIAFSQGDSKRVIVLSIPDYAFTPYGEKSGKAAKISKELDAYNTYAKKISEEKNVAFYDITEITRAGLATPELVATDGLHPSKEAYRLFVEKIRAEAKKIID